MYFPLYFLFYLLVFQNSQCFIGKHKVDSHYAKYGARKYCPPLGGEWSQQVFLRKSVVESEKKKYKEQEVKRASEKAKREYERSVKVAAEKAKEIAKSSKAKVDPLAVTAKQKKDIADTAAANAKQFVKLAADAEAKSKLSVIAAEAPLAEKLKKETEYEILAKEVEKCI